MKNFHIKILASCLSILLSSSCGDESKKEISRTMKDQQAYLGSWVANGSHPMGYSYGKYAIWLDLASDGTCKMKMQYDLYKSPMSDDFSDIVHLNGSWNSKDNKLKADLKITSWVVTDRADYRKEKPFDDFSTQYNFKLENGQLKPDRSNNMSFGTTEQARDMNTIDFKGDVIVLSNIKFHKEINP